MGERNNRSVCLRNDRRVHDSKQNAVPYGDIARDVLHVHCRDVHPARANRLGIKLHGQLHFGGSGGGTLRGVNRQVRSISTDVAAYALNKNRARKLSESFFMWLHELQRQYRRHLALSNVQGGHFARQGFLRGSRNF